MPNSLEKREFLIFSALSEKPWVTDVHVSVYLLLRKMQHPLNASEKTP